MVYKSGKKVYLPCESRTGAVYRIQSTRSPSPMERGLTVPTTCASCWSTSRESRDTRWSSPRWVGTRGTRLVSVRENEHDPLHPAGLFQRPLPPPPHQIQLQVFQDGIRPELSILNGFRRRANGRASRLPAVEMEALEKTTSRRAGKRGSIEYSRFNPLYHVSLEDGSDENGLLVVLKGPKQYSVGFEVRQVSSNRNIPFERVDSGVFRLDGEAFPMIYPFQSGLYRTGSGKTTSWYL